MGAPRGMGKLSVYVNAIGLRALDRHKNYFAAKGTCGLGPRRVTFKGKCCVLKRTKDIGEPNSQDYEIMNV